MRLALAVLHDESGEDVTVQTYNAFAAGIVRDHGLLVGVEPESGLLSEAQQWQLVLVCLDDLPPFDALEIRSSYVVGQTLNLASSVADHMVGASGYRGRGRPDPVAAEGRREDGADRAETQRARVVPSPPTSTRRSERRRIDFGDQITKAVEVLEGHARCARWVSGRFPFVLLDEYQDTNVAQRRMLQALIAPGRRGHRGGGCAAGDLRVARGDHVQPDRVPRRLPAFGRGPVRAGVPVRELPVWLQHPRRGQRSRVVDRSGAASRRSPACPVEERHRIGEHRPVRRRASTRRHGSPGSASSCMATVSVAGQGTRCSGRTWRSSCGARPRWTCSCRSSRRRRSRSKSIGLGGLLKTPEVTEVVAWLRALESKPAANRWLGRILLGPRWRIHYRDLSLLARWATSQNWDLRLRLAGGDEEAARDMEPGDVGYSLGGSAQPPR